MHHVSCSPPALSRDSRKVLTRNEWGWKVFTSRSRPGSSEQRNALTKDDGLENSLHVRQLVQAPSSLSSWFIAGITTIAPSNSCTPSLVYLITIAGADVHLFPFTQTGLLCATPPLIVIGTILGFQCTAAAAATQLSDPLYVPFYIRPGLRMISTLVSVLTYCNRPWAKDNGASFMDSKVERRFNILALNFPEM